MRIIAGGLVLLATLAVGMTGCREAAMSQEAALETVPVKMVWAGHQGGGPSPTASVDWIDGPGAMDTSTSGSGAAQAVLVRSDMDWKRYGLVWIRMGQKRTGGFGIGLAADQAIVDGDTVVLTVHWREPPKGAYVTQMITSPCMALKLPKGGFRKIVIKDQSGRERARADIQPAL